MRVLAAYKDDAASYYRILAPFKTLVYSTDGIDIDIGVPSPQAAAEYDVLWLQQHSDPLTEIVVREFRDRDKKVVYDTDDWLIGVPASWPCYSSYFNTRTGEPTERLIMHQRLLLLANAITTTTPRLAENIKTFLKEQGQQKPVYILPNCIQQGDWDTLLPVENDRDGPVLGWFGTDNHWDTWSDIVEAVDLALEETGGYLALMGYPGALSMFPDRLAKRTLLHPLVAIKDFKDVRRLMMACNLGLAWATGRSEAARCRSPLKALQWGAAGVPIIASKLVYGELQDLDRYVTVVDTPLPTKHELSWAIYRVLSNYELAQSKAEQWQHIVYANHSYETQAQRWLDVLMELGG